ncbi:MAG: M14 family zinc carboxypeptidase [Gammaproteobacteria bacterium]
MLIVPTARAALPPAPLEAAGYARLSSAAEIVADLDALAAASPRARRETVGLSVQQRPLATLVLSSATGEPATPRPTLLLIASQHGAAEPAGGEAMLFLARELLAGALRDVLETFDVVLLPDANPDGRDLGHRANADGVNLNTDFVMLAEPESRALVAALARYRPLAVLDVHESAVLKRRSLAREGYLTDFEAQFETANNPAVPAALLNYGRERLLPRLVALAGAEGLAAQRYIGEITSASQPITNGGLSLRNLRNRAALDGTLAVLTETKLDPSDDPAPTWRNIQVRAQRSLVCQRAFLRALVEQRAAASEVVATARAALPTEPLVLGARYVLDEAHPRVSLPLRRLAGRERVMIDFADHRRVAEGERVPMPGTLVLPAPSEALRAALERQGIVAERQSQALEIPVLAARYRREPQGEVRMTASAPRLLSTAPGALIVDLSQRRGRLAAVLLDPRSPSSLFASAPFAAALDADREFEVYAVRKGVSRGAPAEP